MPTDSTQLFEPINLDGYATVDEMQEVAKVLGALSEYARCKGHAMRTRAQGNIPAALRFENNCQAIYDDLPTWARW